MNKRLYKKRRMSRTDSYKNGADTMMKLLMYPNGNTRKRLYEKMAYKEGLIKREGFYDYGMPIEEFEQRILNKGVTKTKGGKISE